jgi:glucokinase
MALHIGVDIGGTNLRIGVVDGQHLIHESRTEADFSGLCKSHPPAIAWQKIIQTSSKALLAVLDAFPEVVAVGIGFPGFIDPNSQRIAQSPNLPGLQNVDLAADLAPLIGRPVVVENDALAAAYGEFRLHPEDCQNLIYIGLGTGVGGGLILNGQPYPGQHGVAMEVGHIIVRAGGRVCGCGNLGCLEQYASASGVQITYSELTGKHLSAAEIAGMAEQGDIHALAAYQAAGAALAQVLASILKVVDVEHVVIGGGMSQAWALMQPTFDARLDTDLIPVLRGRIRVSISSSGDHAGMIGAALLAAESQRVS